MNKYLYKKIIIASLAALVLTAVSCDDDEDPDVIWGYSADSPAQPTDDRRDDDRPDDEQKPPLVNVNSLYAARLEVPALKDGNIFIQHSTLEGKDSVMTYCVEYDPTKYHSRWVAFRFDDATRPKMVSRKNGQTRPQYPRDPLLPDSYALPDDISFDGYDHGHLCASADRLYSRQGNDNTFYLSNMSPQIGSFNQNYWTGYEEYVQRKGRDLAFADTLYVVKGGTIDDNNIEKYVCNGRLPVPRYYFMALLKVKNNTYSALAFLVEHKAYSVKPTDDELATKIVTIDYLEAFTGIDFFHNLPDVIENQVEANVSAVAWGL